MNLGLECDKYSDRTCCTMHEIAAGELIVIFDQIVHLVDEPELPFIGPKEVWLSHLLRAHINLVSTYALLVGRFKNPITNLMQT